VSSSNVAKTRFALKSKDPTFIFFDLSPGTVGNRGVKYMQFCRAQHLLLLKISQKVATKCDNFVATLKKM